MTEVRSHWAHPPCHEGEEGKWLERRSSHPRCPLPGLADCGWKDHPTGVSAKCSSLNFNSFIGTWDDVTEFSPHSGAVGTIILPILWFRNLPNITEISRKPS